MAHIQYVTLFIVGALWDQVHSLTTTAISPISPQSDRCMDWPVFQSEAELQADKWGKYFQEVYGQLPKDNYPLRIGDYWMFYDSFLQKSGAQAPESVGECPVQKRSTTTTPGTTSLTTTTTTTTTTRPLTGWLQQKEVYYSDLYDGKPVWPGKIPYMKHNSSSELNLGSFDHWQHCQAACQAHDGCHSYTWNLTFSSYIASVPGLCIGSKTVGKRQGSHCEGDEGSVDLRCHGTVSGHDSQVAIVEYVYPDWSSRRRYYPGSGSGYDLAPACTRYTQNNAYQPAGVSWSWHPPHFMEQTAPWGGPTPTGYPFFGDNEWIEVLHKKDPGHDEAKGMWLLYAKGSGIWFNVGKSLRVADHADAYKSLSNLQVPNLTLGDVDDRKFSKDELLSKVACANGITSVQFNNRADRGNYPMCVRKRTYPSAIDTVLNIEILATCFTGTYSCGVAGDGSGNPFKAGWHNKPCHCTNDAEVLNCGHHTSGGSSSRRRGSPTPSWSTASPSTSSPSTASPSTASPSIMIV